MSGNVFLDLILQRPAKLAIRPMPQTSTHAQQKHVNNTNVIVRTTRTGYLSKDNTFVNN